VWLSYGYKIAGQHSQTGICRAVCTAGYLCFRRVNMDIVIREIEEKDYPAVTALLINELWNNKFNDDYIVPFFNKVKNDESYKTFVALLNNNIVGVISTVTMFWAVSEPANTLLVQGFAVKNECQNNGIGTKLLKHTEDYAKAKGIAGIGLCSGFQRTAAHAFYEHNGYIKMTQYFSKLLNPIK
jgi:predicted N-acetyltransferase YhbS